jgi:hypothetical protein
MLPDDDGQISYNKPFGRVYPKGSTQELIICTCVLSKFYGDRLLAHMYDRNYLLDNGLFFERSCMRMNCDPAGFFKGSSGQIYRVVFYVMYCGKIHLGSQEQEATWRDLWVFVMNWRNLMRGRRQDKRNTLMISCCRNFFTQFL